MGETDVKDSKAKGKSQVSDFAREEAGLLVRGVIWAASALAWLFVFFFLSNLISSFYAWHASGMNPERVYSNALPRVVMFAILAGVLTGLHIGLMNFFVALTRRYPLRTFALVVVLSFIEVTAAALSAFAWRPTV